MNEVLPKIHLIAATQLVEPETALAGLGIPDWTTDAHSDGEWLIEFAGKLCYNSFDLTMNKNLTRVGTRNNHDYIHEQILATRHGSVLEHVYATILFQDVSRVVTHELVRHRAGTAFSQTSGRYVRANTGFYFPRVLERIPGARGVFDRAEAQMQENVSELERLSGIDQMKDFGLKKKLTSAFRRLIGNGQANNVLVTANLRAWRHVIALRTNAGAEEEIRYAMAKVAVMLAELYPAVFSDMVATREVDGIAEFVFDYDKV